MLSSGCRVGPNGETSHTAQRATRTIASHGSQPWGTSTERNGEPTTASSIKRRGSPTHRWGLKQVQSGEVCLRSA